MSLDMKFEAFVKASPLSVMMRGILQRFLDAPALDRFFDETAQVQYTRKLLFSQCVQIMNDVVFQTVPSINAWCQNAEDFAFTRQAVYQKIRMIEPAVAAGLVRFAADKARAIIGALKTVEPMLPGYRLRILDGNHLPGTEHRLKPLRKYNAAVLPGQSLVLYDPQYDLITDVFPCEDAYTQERALLGEVLNELRPKDCVLADRNFSTAGFLVRTHARQAYFVIRQHATMKCELLGKACAAGLDGQGRELREQEVKLIDPENGQELLARRISILPKKRGGLKLHVLTNLPASIDACRLGELYRDRWKIETAFQRLQENLRSEINTLAYPKAALFGFCLGCVAYNAVSILQAAVASAQKGDDLPARLSMYYVTLEIARITPGMEILLPDSEWQCFETMSDTEFIATLQELARSVRTKKYATHKRGPKKPPPQKISGKKYRHVSTQRILNAQA